MSQKEVWMSMQKTAIKKVKKDAFFLNFLEFDIISLVQLFLFCII